MSNAPIAVLVHMVHRAPKRLRLSAEVSLENLDPATGDRIIVNTTTGQRLNLSEETLLILDAFRTSRTVQEVAEQLGVPRSEQSIFTELLQPLLSAGVLESEETASPRRLQAQTPAYESLLLHPRPSFANCPLLSPAEIAQNAIVFAGVGLDSATTGEPGTRHGPGRIREVSTQFIRYDRDVFDMRGRGWYSADKKHTILEGIDICDVGDVQCEPSVDLFDLYERCYRTATLIHKHGGFPVFLGGDHSITAPLVRACGEAHEDLLLFHFDAHTDLAEWRPPAAHHHGNVLTRTLRENPSIEVFQVGVRGFAGLPDEQERLAVLSQCEIDRDLNSALERLPRGRTCYISLDVDVIDPAYAPATGTPVPFGMMPTTLLLLLDKIARSNSVVAMDVVELCPHLDRSDNTASLVFHIIMAVLDAIYSSGDHVHGDEHSSR